MQISPSNRLKSLDGIRGLAILAVFLNHIELKIFPSFLSPFGSIIFGSGVLGVSFLFVLSGFLMADIYPNPPSGLAFLQKRYTRIFPLFLTMCAVMIVFRIFPKFVGLWGIGLILLFAGIGHLFWVYGVKKMPPKFGKTLFFCFIAIQILAGGFYAFWVMRHPPIVFNQQIPVFIREGTIGLVNATLTLPLGNYIPMLDGVYWSLAAEVLFYVLYPILCVPAINLLIPKKRITKYLLLISLFPLIAGVDILSRRIAGLSMLQFPLFYCFVTGLTLGYLYKKKPEIVNKITGIFKGRMSYFSLVFFIGFIYLYHYLLDTASSSWASWIHLAFAIPMACIIAIALDQRNFLSKIFSSKVLVFLGIISYSIYLSHTPVIHIASAIYQPTTEFISFIYILLVFLVTIALSRILYILLERPYFMRKKEVKKIVPFIASKMARPGLIALSALCLVYIITTFIAYQSSFNFFSIEYPSKNSFVTPQLKNQKFFSMKDYPTIKMQIQSPEDNLGIIAMHIKHNSASKNTQNILTFHIKEIGAGSWYATTNYKLSTIGDGLNHPFGFPVIPDSKGKTYDVELNLSQITQNDYVSVETSGNSIRTVYPVSKSQLLRNPLRLISFIQKRILNVFSSNEAQLAALLFAPFFLMTLFLFFLRFGLRPWRIKGLNDKRQ